MIHAELLFPGESEWFPITGLIVAESFTFHLQIMNRDCRSVVDTVACSLAYDQLLLSRLLAIQPKEQVLLRCCDLLGSPCFSGYLAATVKHETTDLPEWIRIEGRDNSWKLDRPLAEDIFLPASIHDPGVSVFSCFSTIIQAAGHLAGEIALDCIPAPEIVPFLVGKQGEGTYRELLDDLLHDYGYTFTMTAEGRFTLYRWLDEQAVPAGTVSGEVSVSEPFCLEKQDEVHDGIRLTWGKPALLEDVCLYRAQLPISPEGIPSGQVIPPGGYWPADGDLVETWQVYRQEWLDRAYLERQSRQKNQDLALIRAEDPYLVLTADAGITVSEDYQPLQAKILLHNPTAVDLKLSVFEIWGSALVREKLCQTILPSEAGDPARLEAPFIAAEEAALRLARGCFARQQFGDLTYGFSLYQRSYEPGERVRISQLHPYLETEAIITELRFTDELPGFRYTAVGTAEFGDLEAVTTAYAASNPRERGQKGEDAIHVEIISHHGTIFRPAVVETTLEARVYQGGEDVTGRYADADFRWVRRSEDDHGDAVWNSAHYSAGGKTLAITDADVYGRAVFFCELLTKR